jgi:hypothetical protein
MLIASSDGNRTDEPYECNHKQVPKGYRRHVLEQQASKVLAFASHDLKTTRPDAKRERAFFQDRELDLSGASFG